MSRGRVVRGGGDGGGGRNENGFEEQGGYMAAKRAKLSEQFAAAQQTALVSRGAGGGGGGGGGSALFCGVRVFVNGRTEPPAAELRRLMLTHGGEFQHYYRSRGARRTTHVLASALSAASRRRDAGKLVVRPQWVTDCLAAGRLLDCAAYLLTSDQPQQQLEQQPQQELDPQEDEEGSWHGEESEDDSAKHFDEEMQDITADISVSPHPNTNSSRSGAAGDLSWSTSAVCRSPASSATTHTEPSPVRRAGEPGFLQQYFSKSRLHHISEMKAHFVDYVASLQREPRTAAAAAAVTAGRQALLRWCRSQSRDGADSQGAGHVTDSGSGGGGDGVDCSNSSDNPLGDSAGSGGDDPVVKEVEPHCNDVRAAGVDAATVTAAAAGAAATAAAGGASVSGSEWRGVVAHIDLDCFFVSVGLLTRRHLIGLPVAVTHCCQSAAAASSSWAEVASCSYEARAVGVRNGMLMHRAVRLCPQLHTIPYEFGEYRRVAQAMYATVAGLSHRIEAVSCDELLLDCDEVLRSTGVTPGQLASYLQHAIGSATGGCPVSVGVAESVLVARLATAAAKPAGCRVVLGTTASDSFVAAQPVARLPGVGAATARALHALGCSSCEQLRQLSVAQLAAAVGGERLARRLHAACRARDTVRGAAGVRPSTARRSVSVEINYGVRFTERCRLAAFVGEVCDELARRVQTAPATFHSHHRSLRLTLRLMVRCADAPHHSAKYLGHGRCDVVSRSAPLPAAPQMSATVNSSSTTANKNDNSSSSRARAMQVVCSQLFDTFAAVPASDVRGVALQLSVASSERPSVKLAAPSSAAAASASHSILSMFNRTRCKATSSGGGGVSVSSSGGGSGGSSRGAGGRWKAGASHAQTDHECASVFGECVSLDAALDLVGGVSAVSHDWCGRCSAPRPEPHFFGTGQHWQIDSLFDEWVVTGAGAGADRGVVPPPVRADCRAVTDYLCGLVDAWMLARVRRLLRQLHNRARQLELPSEWRLQLDTITDEVQLHVRHVHGAPVKLD